MNDYIKNISRIFLANRNLDYAIDMKRYMRNKFEFVGIKSPIRKELSKPFLKKANLPPVDSIEEIVKEFWKKPEREFQYFAMILLSKYSKKLDANDYKLFEYMIINKSWWDSIDYISPHLVSTHFKLFPQLTKPISEKWVNSNNMWLQRSAILFQLKYKTETDTELLFNYINRLASSKEFFIRKAIGWSLREYSKTDPKLVLEYVTRNEDKLSGLSKREALKIIIKK